MALSDISCIAISAISAALAVSPAILCKRLAEKLVVSSMYSLALMPAVRYASAAFCLTLSALSLNSVSMPPMLCCSAAPSVMVADKAFPMAAVAIMPFNAPMSFPPKPFPAAAPALSASPPKACVMLPLMPCADGTICT